MSPLSRLLSVITVVGVLAAHSFACAASSKPTAVTPDGGRYYGALVDGKLHGRGRLEWANGDHYEGSFARGHFSGYGQMRWASGQRSEGQFRNGALSGHGSMTMVDGTVYVGQFDKGMFNGHGRLRMPAGEFYEGSFKNGTYDGKGRFEKADGEVYEGDFQKNDFTGHGSHTTKQGTRHEGQFLKWRPNGSGGYTDAYGNVYEGQFTDGELVGVGRITSKSGGSYEGELKEWRAHGQGVLRLQNGDVYKGGFNYGVYDGQGTLTYAKPHSDGRTELSGLWRYGKLADKNEELQAKENVELALYNQRALLDKAIAALAPRDPARINLYFLAVAGDGSQEVFRREVEFVRGQFDREFGTSGRSLALVNSRTTVASAPMATVTSIRESLKAVAARMDAEKDILFFFLTSHGSKEHEFTLNQNNMRMRGLSASELGKLLKESGIRWKVVVVSACYSGGFIDAVKDDHTLVITAARHDRTSFGCADENDFTYFGRAFFKDALPTSASFQEAFRKAEVMIREWESKDLKDEERERGESYSVPQILETPAVARHLERWWSQRGGSARRSATTASTH